MSGSSSRITPKSNHTNNFKSNHTNNSKNNHTMNRKSNQIKKKESSSSIVNSYYESLPDLKTEISRQKNETDSVLLKRMDRHICYKIRASLRLFPELNDMIPPTENETIAERLAKMRKHISNQNTRYLLVKQKEILETFRPKENCEEIDFIKHDCHEGLTDYMIDEIDRDGTSGLNFYCSTFVTVGYLGSRIMDLKNEKHETQISM